MRSFEDIEKLYHVVFVNNHFNHVEILNNNLEKVTEFALLEHSRCGAVGLGCRKKVSGWG